MAVDPRHLNVGDVLYWSEAIENKLYVGREAVVVSLPHNNSEYSMLETKEGLKCLHSDEIEVLYKDLDGKTRTSVENCVYFDKNTFRRRNKELDSLFDAMF